MKRRVIVLACVLSASLTGCSRWFFVRPIGSLASGIRFEFTESLGGEKSRFRIIHLAVLAIENAGVESTPVWSLRGGARVAEIEYGRAPRGLSEVVSAAPLLPGRVPVAPEVNDDNVRYWMKLELLCSDEQMESLDFDSFCEVWMAVVETEEGLRVGYWSQGAY